MAQDKDQWQFLGNMIINLQATYKALTLSAELLSDSLFGLSSMELVLWLKSVK
jgi:hypothetical protein